MVSIGDNVVRRCNTIEASYTFFGDIYYNNSEIDLIISRSSGHKPENLAEWGNMETVFLLNG